MIISQSLPYPSRWTTYAVRSTVEDLFVMRIRTFRCEKDCCDVGAILTRHSNKRVKQKAHASPPSSAVEMWLPDSCTGHFYDWFKPWGGYLIHASLNKRNESANWKSSIVLLWVGEILKLNVRSARVETFQILCLRLSDVQTPISICVLLFPAYNIDEMKWNEKKGGKVFCLFLY